VNGADCAVAASHLFSCNWLAVILFRLCSRSVTMAAQNKWQCVLCEGACSYCSAVGCGKSLLYLCFWYVVVLDYTACLFYRFPKQLLSSPVGDDLPLILLVVINRYLCPVINLCHQYRLSFPVRSLHVDTIAAVWPGHTCACMAAATNDIGHIK
jgi:hypothetical protein